MTFMRTPGGLKSLASIHGVDRVFFCEGGSPATTPNATGALQGTLDELFWSNFFAEFGVAETVRVVSQGSRPAVEKLIDVAISQKISSIGGCLDRDWTNIKPKSDSGVIILTTSGYSWENDCLSTDTIEVACENFLHPSDDLKSLLKDQIKNFTEELEYISEYVELDEILILNGNTGFFPRDKPLALLEQVGKISICFDRSKVSGRQATLSVSSQNCVNKNNVDYALKNIYGHTLIRFALHKFGSFIFDHTSGKLSHDLFMRMLIKNFFPIIRSSNCSLNAHYSACAALF